MCILSSFICQDTDVHAYMSTSHKRVCTSLACLRSEFLLASPRPEEKEAVYDDSKYRDARGMSIATPTPLMKVGHSLPPLVTEELLTTVKGLQKAKPEQKEDISHRE
eukprot:Lankesteria_metandrocarpae@DN2202_c0_g1_i3.p1